MASPKLRRAICWLRRDLRTSDHAVFAEANRLGFEAVPCFIFDSKILDQLEDRDDRRVTMIHQAVDALRFQLSELGSGIVVRHGDPSELIPLIAAEYGAEVVICAEDYEPYAIERDLSIKSRLAEMQVEFTTVLDHLIFRPGEVLSQENRPLTVFTAFKRVALSKLTQTRYAAKESDDVRFIPINEIEARDFLRPVNQYGFDPIEVSPAFSETAGFAQLADFLSQIDTYNELRDFPSLNQTSHLSAYLRFGTISIRECFRVAMARNSPGAAMWISELMWREFYFHILYHFPHVVSDNFRPQYKNLSWMGDLSHFDAWKNGNTGYPLVDAAMRCLKATGWMHNRLRMVAAMFLTKDLLLDWRLGEAHFARYLIDFELASNNGGWQWCASTGCDAQPYFRIFNPITQSRKFDAQGKFIRKWVPELRYFTDERIHTPWESTAFEQIEAGCMIGSDYPAPIVDHQVQRELAMRMFQVDAGTDVALSEV